MRPRLRPVAPSDLAELARLHALCFPDDAWTARALLEVLALPGAAGWIAVGEGGGRLGFLFDLTVAGEAEILTIGVSPEQRRHGVARHLLKDLFTRAQAAGAQSVVLEVAADNPPALRLYESSGFRIVGQRRGYYQRRSGEPIDAWLLRRSLSA